MVHMHDAGTHAWGSHAWGTHAWGTHAWRTHAWGTHAWGTHGWGQARMGHAHMAGHARMGHARMGHARMGDTRIWAYGTHAWGMHACAPHARMGRIRMTRVRPDRNPLCATCRSTPCRCMSPASSVVCSSRSRPATWLVKWFGGCLVELLGGWGGAWGCMGVQGKARNGGRACACMHAGGVPPAQPRTSRRRP